MALTAQDIMNGTSQDVRSLLTTSSTVLLDYVNRVHLDCLHDSVYSWLITDHDQGFLVSANFTVQSTAPGGTPFAFTNEPRRILFIFNETDNTVLRPFSSLFSSTEHPDPTSGSQTKAVLAELEQTRLQQRLRTLSGRAEYYQLTTTAGAGGAASIRVFPKPAQAATLGIYSERIVATIAAAGTTLLLPEDAKDMLVAGVNMLGSMFLRRYEDTKFWQGEYERLKKGGH